MRRHEPFDSFRSSIAPLASPCAAGLKGAIGGVHRGESASAATEIFKASLIKARGLVGYSDDDYAGTLGAFWALHVAKAIMAQTSWGRRRATAKKRRGMTENNGQPTLISEVFFRIEKLDTNGVSQRRIAGKIVAHVSTEKRFMKGEKTAMKTIIAGRE